MDPNANADPTDDADLKPATDELDEDDDGLDEDEFSTEDVSLARSLGLDVDDFENSADFYRAAESKIEAMKQAPAAKAEEKKDEELVLAALEVALENKSDLDENLVKAIETLAARSGENFQKIVKRLEAGPDGNQALTKRLDQLAASVTSLGAQNVQLRLDRWIARSEDLQKYLGKGDTGELDSNDKFSRRRRALITRADKIASNHRGDFTMEQMFKAAVKKMRPSSSDANKDTKKTGKAKPTRIARASGPATNDMEAEAGTEKSMESVRREAADVVGKFRRNAG